MINAIKEKGHTVCCCTNSIRKTAYLMLEKTGIKNLFHEILTNQDVEKPKPDPEGYLFLMNKHGYSSDKTYIIEDSPKGIEAATKSGANVIKVRNSGEVNIETIRNFI
jgi:HAD superfamily hydrolase (TIGR01509 family)